jgi:hypothetical protein
VTEPVPLCGRCKMPAVLVGGQWAHAEPADSVFCTLIMRGEVPGYPGPDAPAGQDRADWQAAADLRFSCCEHCDHGADEPPHDESCELGCNRKDTLGETGA